MRALALLLIVCACAPGADLLIGAASDLGPISEKLAPAAGAAVGATVRFTLASSGSLSQQVENGAPFDVFLSASESYVSDLVKKGFLEPSTVSVYALGRIAVWSKRGSVRTLDDLRKREVQHIAIPNPDHAPYGIAAREALEKQGIWTSVQSKIVYGENVSQALQFAESGNAEAVITSWTLLQGRGVLIPENLYNPIRQAGAVLKSSKQQSAAKAFLMFLGSADGKKILAAGGLFPP
jgi:molybdate transport system substrate-binding protein